MPESFALSLYNSSLYLLGFRRVPSAMHALSKPEWEHGPKNKEAALLRPPSLHYIGRSEIPPVGGAVVLPIAVDGGISGIPPIGAAVIISMATACLAN
jgi:hypothetical protein